MPYMSDISYLQRNNSLLPLHRLLSPQPYNAKSDDWGSNQRQLNRKKREDVRRHIYDAYRFLRMFTHPISISAPHIYISALVFTPRTSHVLQTGHRMFPNRLVMSEGGLMSWPPCIQTCLGHQSYVKSVAFSPDGSRIASGSSDHSIRIWDADTGQAVGEPLLGHTDWIISVVFSPDGHKIASGSRDQSIRIWDAETRQAVGEPFLGHTSLVV